MRVRREERFRLVKWIDYLYKNPCIQTAHCIAIYIIMNQELRSLKIVFAEKEVRNDAVSDTLRPQLHGETLGLYMFETDWVCMYSND